MKIESFDTIFSLPADELTSDEIISILLDDDLQDFDTDLDGLLLRVVLSPHVPFAKQEFPTPILHSCQHFL
jgi:hypothetical protein